jgi:predicted NAD-dependent protein-ADP-ribosyltransferase YbiA (DUF1768 family)
MACPNINSSEWKALVEKIGENNAWKEYLIHDRIPDASIYKVEESKGKKVLYSIKTKTTTQLSNGIDPELIKSQREIKYTSFILTGLLNTLGDVTPGKVLDKTPDQAFNEIKTTYTKLRDSINMSLESFIKTDADLAKVKASSSFPEILKKFPVLAWVKTHEELIGAQETFTDIIAKWQRYEDFVKADLRSKGLKIVKNKIQTIDHQDIENSNQDNTEDTSIPNEEVNPQKFDASIFEVNPYDTATVRVKALVQTIRTGEFEFGIPLYADPSDVLDDILYAGTSMNLSGFKDKAAKLDVFREALAMRQDGRPYIKELLQKINDAEQKGDWAIINQMLTFASKAFANEEILLYTLRKTGSKVNGVSGVKIIGGNRDTVIDQIKRDWLSKHMQSGFYNKAADGKLTPKPEKLAELEKIRKEGEVATGDAQKQKFIDYFKVLGIEFTMKDLELIAPNISKKFRKGKDFKVVFTDVNLLQNIHTDFTKNLEVPFEGQYGFQNEGREMGLLAQLYFDATPNVYKAGSTKTADGKTKYLYIQTNNAEISKREFENGDGTSVTNTALAKPNVSFWKKVKQSIAKFILGYFNGSREQEAGKDGKVRKNFTEKEQIVNMLLGHQADMKEGTYTTFTLSDKTTSMQAKMTKEFFVDDTTSIVGLTKDYSITKSGEIEYTPKFKDRVYNSFIEPEVSRILAALKYGNSVNLENFGVSSKLFYFFPRLNADPALEDFRKDLYSNKFTIEQLNTKHSKAVADVIIDEFTKSSENEIDKFITNGIIEVNDQGDYKFPLYKDSYLNRFRETNATKRTLARLMSMDMKLNYMNSQIKTVQFLKFDPMHAFKAPKTVKDFESLSGEDKVKLANSTWDEFSKRAAALIAPGSQGNWSWKYGGNKTYNATQTYNAVTLKDIKKDNDFFEGFESTDAQEFVTVQEHIDYLMSEGRIPLATWESVHNKIEKAGKGGYYELTKEELGHVLTPMKPVYAGGGKEGPAEAGLNRYDYVKSSRYPLIPQHEAGSERDKLRQWMEKNNIQSANFGSGKKLGRPSLSVEVFDTDNNFIEPKDFQKGIQELSRDGLRNQQEIPHQKTEISTVTQMNRTLFDGLLDTIFNFSGMSGVTGTEMKGVKEAIRSKMFDNAAAELREKMGDLNKTNVGLYNLLKDVILNDTTGSYTKNDLRSIELRPDGMFKTPLEAQFKFQKFQGLINSMINKNVMLKIEGTSFVQVSGAGSKFSFKDLSKGAKSDIVWTDSFAKKFKDGEAKLDYISKDKNGIVKPAQVLVSQYLRDSKGELINLADFITEKDGVKILDTSRFSPEMLQLVASRIPNQSHVSMLPIEVVGFLPSYMENTIVVPDGITGQMGSDFDVDKLFAYTSKIVEGKNKKGQVTYGPVEYEINSKSDVNGLNPDQLVQAYRDMHWNVLTHEDTFEKITKSVDMDEVKEKVKMREQQLAKYGIVIDKGANLPLDYQTSINRFMDNKSGKDGVSIFANLISAQADMQDKPLTLGYIDKTTGKEEKVPLKIKLSKNGEVIDLLYVGKTGSSKSFLYEPGVVPERSISDNLNIEFTESVDNAKNQFLREFGWDNKSMGAVGMLSMLTDANGQAVPIEFMMDLTSQPEIKKLLEAIDLKQDSFGTFDSDALNSSVVELQKKIEETIDSKRFLKVGDQAGTYLTDEKRDRALDPETLSDMWIVGQAIKAGEDPATLEKIAKDLKYDSVDDMMLKYYTTQYDSLETFQRLNSLGRELMTMLGSLYTYTKGIGPTVFTAKQKMNQLNKLSSSQSFLGIDGLAGSIEKNKDTGLMEIAPIGELGSSIVNSLIVAQSIYGKLFPIATGKNMESIVTTLLDGMGLSIDEIGGEKYENIFQTVFKASIHYLYTNPDLELFDDVRATRDRLINGDNSLANRITKLKEDPKMARNGFLKNLQTDPVWNSDMQTISFKSPFGTDVDYDAVEAGFFELATYKGDNEQEIRELARDLALYVFATGDAGSLGKFIPVDYYMSDKEFARGMRRIRGTYVSNTTDDAAKLELIDQIVQNNPDDFSKKFNFASSESYESTFKTALKPLIGKADDLSKVSKFTISRGDFKGDKAKGIVNALTVPLSGKEIAEAIQNGIDPYKIDENGNQVPKSKYPPYILISDTFTSEYDQYDANRNIKYLYKRTSKALNAEGNATYERINILGVGNIKEYDSNVANQGLKSVIKNNDVDTIVDPAMYPDGSESKEEVPEKSSTKPAVKKPEAPKSMGEITNHSGGAALSDAEWDQIGREYGVVNHKHYREPLEYTDTKGQPAKGSEDVDSKKLVAAGIKPTHITQADYDEGAQKATQAFRMMFEDAGKKAVRSAYIIRNWMQVKNADAIFALGTIKQPGENASDKTGETRIAAVPLVKGGTGYAVQMGINEGKPVYVFDGTKEGWYRYDYSAKNFVKTDTPTLTKNFAGIGSRTLSTQEVIDKSLQAIRDVYEKTQKSLGVKQSSTEEKTNKINIYSTDKNGFEDLSNFAKRPFVVNGITFPSVEHAYQWSKGMYYNTGAIDPSSDETPEDQEAKVRKHMASILAAKTGADAKALGRKDIDVEFENEMWNTDSSGIMKMLIQKSFEQNPEAAAKLLSTGDAELTHTQDKTKWATEFPKLLMEVREDLKNPKEEKEILSISLQYGGKGYILEGSKETSFKAYYQAGLGKGKPVTDKSLLNKILVTHAVNIHPEKVVTLTNIQNNPRYYVTPDGNVLSLSEGNYGNKITSESVIKQVLNKLNNKIEDDVVLEAKPPQPGEKPTFSYNGITVNTEFPLSAEQTKALTNIIDFVENPSADAGLYTGTYTLEGYAGTGKTSIIGVLEKYTKAKNKHTEFIYMAPTHAATVALGLNVVKYGSKNLPMTVQSSVLETTDKITGQKIIKFTKKFTDRAKGIKNVIVLDEASMLADKDFIKTVTAAKGQGYQIIFLGDPKQIPEVLVNVKEKPLAKAFDNPNKSVLTQVFRTKDNNILNVLTNIRNNTQFEEQKFASTDNMKRLSRSDYNDELIKDLQNNLEDTVIINYTNDGVAKINQRARSVLGFEGELKVGEKIVGYLGSQTKQIEKGDLANSVSYMVDNIVKEDSGVVIVTAHSKLLGNLLKQGMSGFKENTTFKYLQLSETDSFNFNLTKEQMQNNKDLLKEYLKEINNLNFAYSNKKMHYVDYTRAVEEVRKSLANINTGNKYIYNPKTDQIELYNSITHKGINANLEIDKGVDYGYGITVHKSQGMTIPIVYFDTNSLSAVQATNIIRDGKVFNTEKNALYYVGMSRASQKLVVPINETSVNDDGFGEEFGSNDNEPEFDLLSFFATNFKTAAAENLFGAADEIPPTTKQILNDIYKDASPLYKQILSLIGQTGGVGGLKIIVDKTITDPGEYLNGVIRINPDLAIADGTNSLKEATDQLHELVMHELLHHITSDLLNANALTLSIEQRKWVVALKTLFNTTQERFLKDPKHSAALKAAIAETKKENGFLSKSDKSMYYGLTNVDDFVSMLMTDKTFRDLMNETTYEGNKSILDRFIELLGKILEALGVQVKDNSVLKEGITDIVGLIKSRPIETSENDGSPFKSITTESAKVKNIKENFESLVEALNIKSQC